MKFTLTGKEISEAISEYIGKRYVPKCKEVNVEISLIAERSILGSYKFYAEVEIKE